MGPLETGRIIPGNSRLPEDLEGRYVAACQMVSEDWQAREVVLTGMRTGWTFGLLPDDFVELQAPPTVRGVATSYNLRLPVLAHAVRSLHDQGAIQAVTGRNRLDPRWREKVGTTWQSGQRAWDRRNRLDKGALIHG